MIAPPESLIGLAGVHSTSKVITEKAENVIRQSVLQELKK